MLNQSQKEIFEREGVLVLENLLSNDEIGILNEETNRLSMLKTDEIFQAGSIMTIYRSHESDGPTASPAYRASAQIPRTLGIAQELLGDELYIHNSRIYLKKAFNGLPMLWHQDYGYWRLDGVRAPSLATVMIMLGDVNALSGALWVIPRSHKLGLLKHSAQFQGEHKQIAVRPTELERVFPALPEPVVLEGKAGTAAIFHANTIHGSGINLSNKDRWQFYLAFNQTRNAPSYTGLSRPDYMSSRNTVALSVVEEDAILAAQ